MNKKKILLAVNIILTCLILWMASTIVTTWRSEERLVRTMEERNPKQEAKGPKTSGQTRRNSDYQAVIQQDIFRTTQWPDTVKVEEKKIEPTSLNLKLKGVVTGRNNRSFAVVVDGGTLKEGIYYPNDTIQNARIAKVLGDRVILEINNRQEALLLFTEKDDTENEGRSKQTVTGRVFGPTVVPGPPPVDPTKSSLGVEVARRLPAVIRRKKR